MPGILNVFFGKSSARVTTLISRLAGTTIGTMTTGGGLAAAFDGTTSQSQAASANRGASSGYTNSVGKDWGSGVTKKITRFKVYAPNDASFCNTVSTSIKLQGSTDNFSASTVDLYTSGSIASSNGQTHDVTSGINVSTAYQYHRINIDGNGVNTSAAAEVEFYEDI